VVALPPGLAGRFATTCQDKSSYLIENKLLFNDAGEINPLL
jgi:hypothetical protein